MNDKSDPAIDKFRLTRNQIFAAAQVLDHYEPFKG